VKLAPASVERITPRPLDRVTARKMSGYRIALRPRPCDVHCGVRTVRPSCARPRRLPRRRTAGTNPRCKLGEIAKPVMRPETTVGRPVKVARPTTDPVVVQENPTSGQTAWLSGKALKAAAAPCCVVPTASVLAVIAGASPPVGRLPWLSNRGVSSASTRESGRGRPDSTATQKVG